MRSTAIPSNKFDSLSVRIAVRGRARLDSTENAGVAVPCVLKKQAEAGTRS